MFYFLACLFTLFCCTALQSGVLDHLKSVGSKSKGHTIPGVDFIYMINLDERPEKFALACQFLAPYGIVPYRFSAVNGWKIPVADLEDIGVRYGPWMESGKVGTCFPVELQGEPEHGIMAEIGKNWFCYDMTVGGIGIALSHLSILQDAYNAGYQTIWVMEDDIQVVNDPLLISNRIHELDQLVGPEGWDILFTDLDTKSQEGEYVPCYSYAWRPDFIPKDPARFALKEQIHPRLRQIGARYGAYSMIVRRSGMKKLLDFFRQHQLFLPYDMEYTLPPRIRLFTVMQDIVSTQPQAPSDNRFPNYKHQTR